MSNAIERRSIADEEGKRRTRLAWRRPAVLLVAVILLAVAAHLLGVRGWIDLRTLTTWLDSIGSLWWAPLALVGLYIAFNLLALPGSILTLAAGFVWGWVLGGLLALAGSTVGTALPYLLARSHAPFIEEHMRARAARLHARLQQEGVTALLMLRLVPGVPYSLINYAAGFAGIRPFPYFAATFVGTIPGAFIVTYLADAVYSGLISLQGAFARLAIAGFLLGGLVLASRLVSKRFLK
ncbi:MAG TPA: VTT domain-containing protein [Thermoanaerobaculia bacterium]|nr:VTT domain-containing protein [Thermoanaerobaculia bacterium]